MDEVLNQSRLGNAAQKMKEGALEMKSAVVQQSGEVFQQAVDQTEAAIKEYPHRSVLIAFGVGALLGALIFRR